MAYDNYLEAPTRQSKRTRFTRFALNVDDDKHLLGNQYVSEKQNVKTKRGYIENGESFGAFQIGTIDYSQTFAADDCQIFYFRKYDFEKNVQDDKLVCYIGANQPLRYLHLCREDSAVYTLSQAVFMSIPNFINYRLGNEDVLIMTGENNSMLIWNGEEKIESVVDSPKISSMTMHYERLFATDSARPTFLWFSDDLDPRNWQVSLDEAGYIEIVDEKGSLNKVISFLDYVYIFKSYGIARLAAFSDQSQFSVSEIYSSMGKIYPNTVKACGDKILFLCSDGLYVFDGLSTRRLDIKIQNKFSKEDFSKSHACFYNNKYYLAYADSVIVLDLVSSYVELIQGVVVTCFAAIMQGESMHLCAAIKKGEGISLCEVKENGDGNVLKKTVVFHQYDYGSFDKLKLFKDFYVMTEYPLMLYAKTESEAREIAVLPSIEVQKIPMFLSGKYFGFSLQTQGDICVSAISLDYEVL